MKRKRTNQFVYIPQEAEEIDGTKIHMDPTPLPVNTPKQVTRAARAVRAAGLDNVPIWFGTPGEPDSYQSHVQKLFAAHRKPLKR